MSPSASAGTIIQWTERISVLDSTLIQPVCRDGTCFRGKTEAKGIAAFLQSLDYSELHGITFKPKMSGSKHGCEWVSWRQIGIIFYLTKRNKIQQSRFQVLGKYVLSMLLFRRRTENTLFQTRKRRCGPGFVSCGREGPSMGVKVSGSFQTNKCGCHLSDPWEWVLQKTAYIFCVCVCVDKYTKLFITATQTGYNMLCTFLWF